MFANIGKLSPSSLIGGLRRRLGLSVPANLETDMLRLQHSRISARVPFLYVVIAVVAFAAALGADGSFSWIYHAALPGFFLGMAIFRGLVWRRRRSRILATGVLKKQLRNTVIIAIIMGLVGSMWTMDAFYATVEVRRILAPIFLFMIVFASVISMLSLPNAAIGAILGGLTWPTLVMISSPDPGIRSLGMCFGTVAVMLIGLTQHQFADMLASMKMRAELRRLAETDPLTGLSNRRAFERKFTDLGRDGEKCLRITMIDLDDFKRANDAYGHAAGDAILEQVAERLLQLCPGAENIARIGGDEFALLTRNIAASDYPDEEADAIKKSLALPYVFEGKAIRISASLGMARSPNDGEHLQQLMKNADSQLYRDKSGTYPASGKAAA